MFLWLKNVLSVTLALVLGFQDFGISLGFPIGESDKSVLAVSVWLLARSSNVKMGSLRPPPHRHYPPAGVDSETEVYIFFGEHDFFTSKLILARRPDRTNLRPAHRQSDFP